MPLSSPATVSPHRASVSLTCFVPTAKSGWLSARAIRIMAVVIFTTVVRASMLMPSRGPTSTRHIISSSSLPDASAPETGGWAALGSAAPSCLSGLIQMG